MSHRYSLFRSPHTRYRLGVALCALFAAQMLNSMSAPATWADTSSAAPKVVQSLRDTTGKTLTIPAPGHKATVLVFIAHDCPISNAYAREVSRIADEYGQRGVQLFVVYAENGLSLAGARQHAKDYGYQVPTFLDATHRLSKAAGATVTPEAVVLDAEGKRLYLGRIDNLYAGYGKKRTQPTERDLRAALDATLAGKPVPHSTTTAIGCFIPDTP